MLQFPQPVAALLATDRLAPLGPGRPDESQRAALAALRVDDFAPLDALAAKACLAGLWLYFDFLNESHSISQDLPDSHGAFWHAIMHRREPDAWNSKYWFRKVGRHPVLTSLAGQAPALGYRYTTPEAFIDFVERARATGTADEETAIRVQLLEWKLLFDHSANSVEGGQ
jgi:hypothetical protein